MNCDLVIKKGKIVKPDGTISADILVRGRKIAGLVKGDSGIKAKKTIDADGCYILPGVIDPHVHLTAGGSPFAMNCRTETRSALIGGVTTLFHFLRTSNSYFDLIEDYAGDVKKHSLIDVGFHILVMNERHVDEMPRYLKEMGIRSFKFLMAYRGDPAAPLTGVDDGLLFKGFNQISKLRRGLAMVHAENNDIVNRAVEEVRKQNGQDLKSWSHARPAFCEEEAIRRAIFLAEKAGAPLYISHLSIGKGVHLIAREKLKKVPLFVETAGHYLTLTESFNPPKVTLGKVNPPLRTAEDNRQLWSGVRDGVIDTLGSDHCPYTLKFKGDDLWLAGSGISGVAMTLPLLLSEGVRK